MLHEGELVDKGGQNGDSGENEEVGDEPRKVKGAVFQAHYFHSFSNSLLLLSHYAIYHSEIRQEQR